MNLDAARVSLEHRRYEIGSPSPLLGATRPYVPGGTAMESCVSMRALPRAGMTFFSALHHEELATKDLTPRRAILPIKVVTGRERGATRW
jgi:hypothetical protein